MAGYIKRIAVIKGVSNGFSSGAPLAGLVKAEKYGGVVSVEASLINFAPLSEGKYTLSISDGLVSETFDCPGGERGSDIDISDGFAAVICFVHGTVQTVASAVCGDKGYALMTLKRAAESEECVPVKDKKSEKKAAASDGGEKYCDEAIAEVNYYEFDKVEDKKREDCGSVADKKAEGRHGEKNENDSGSGKEFFAKVADEVRRILDTYPAEEQLNAAVENSRWVKIDYGDGKNYVFGVIYGEFPEYLCYGVPANGRRTVPESLKEIAVYIPTDGGGYYVGCQSAQTGKTIKNKN